MKGKQRRGNRQSLRGVLDKELGSHVDAHLRALHLPHIQKASSIPAATKTARGKARYTLAAKLPVYTASCGSLARHGLIELKKNGWMLLVHSATGLLAHVEVQKKQKGYVVSRVSTGALPEEVSRAVERARKSTERRARVTQLRALSIPAMHILAVWVHQPNAVERDTLIPVTANFAGLSRQREYPRRRVDQLLRKHAMAMILHWYDRLEQQPPPNRPTPAR
jgi:hypothetical protein